MVIANSKITFSGNNSLVFLSSNRYRYGLDVTLYNNSVFAMGKDNYINKVLTVILSEERNVIIGSDGLISFDTWVRTADPHLIYDSESMQRINHSSDVFIGDHVWIGQSALILKGSVVGSGSIIGARSVCAGKTIPSNSSWAGNPIRCLRKNIFWDKSCVNSYQREETLKSNSYTLTDHIFHADLSHEKDIRDFLSEIDKCKTAIDKMHFLSKTFSRNADRNRFYVELDQLRQKKNFPFWRILGKRDIN